jgi:hypothetical protein
MKKRWSEIWKVKYPATQILLNVVAVCQRKYIEASEILSGNSRKGHNQDTAARLEGSSSFASNRYFPELVFDTSLRN